MATFRIHFVDGAKLELQAENPEATIKAACAQYRCVPSDVAKCKLVRG